MERVSYSKITTAEGDWVRKAILSIVLAVSAVLSAQNAPVDIGVAVKTPFRFVAFGDTRFTNPQNTGASNAAVRQAMVKAIAGEHPAFISIGGDIVYNGYNANDWKVYDEETRLWKETGIPVYPALGNHDLHGDLRLALANYFARFPDLQKSWYYSVHAGNSLMLVLDSSEDETSGAQGEWLKQKFDTLSPDVSFVFVVLHHPPYTNSSNRDVLRGGGHSARAREKKLARWLEARQQHLHATIMVFSGHVHNYERHEHGGITYFVTGGGGAHPYHISRAADDPLRGFDVNYHYLLVEVKKDTVKVTMKRLEFIGDHPKWTAPDSVTIQAQRPASASGVSE